MKENEFDNYYNDTDLEEITGGEFWKCGCGKYHHMTDVVCPKIKKKIKDEDKKEVIMEAKDVKDD